MEGYKLGLATVVEMVDKGIQTKVPSTLYTPWGPAKTMK